MQKWTLQKWKPTEVDPGLPQHLRWSSLRHFLNDNFHKYELRFFRRFLIIPLQNIQFPKEFLEYIGYICSYLPKLKYAQWVSNSTPDLRYSQFKLY